MEFTMDEQLIVDDGDPNLIFIKYYKLQVAILLESVFTDNVTTDIPIL